MLCRMPRCEHRKRSMETVSREVVSHSCFLAYLNAACYAPGAVHWGTCFFEQSCISIEFRYNTNKDCFLILYFIWEGDSLWQERRTPMRRGRR